MRRPSGNFGSRELARSEPSFAWKPTTMTSCRPAASSVPDRAREDRWTLLPGPNHGHAIAKHIQHTSEDLLKVETGSLYPALYRLEANDWITAYWEKSDKGRRARYYRITPLGRKQLLSEESKWNAFARAMGLLLKPIGGETR